MNIQGNSLAEVLNGDAVNNKPRLANKERSEPGNSKNDETLCANRDSSSVT